MLVGCKSTAANVEFANSSILPLGVGRHIYIKIGAISLRGGLNTCTRKYLVYKYAEALSPSLSVLCYLGADAFVKRS